MRLFAMLRVTAALVVVAAAPLAAQGNLSTQGFGYPPGQLSTRSIGSAGAFGEFDAQSPINPAALASDRALQLHFQYDPEFQSVTVGKTHENSTISRFPLALLSGPILGHGAVALSWSTLLDRTFQVSQTSTVANFTDPTRPTTATETVQSTGAINDIRLAGAWAFGSWLAVGAGLDLFTGENRLVQTVVLDDTVLNQTTQSQFKNSLSYSGIGYSGGITVRPTHWLGLAGSFRNGGEIGVREGDSAEVARGRVPDRVGGAILLNPVTGLLVSGRVDWEGWSRLNEIGQTNLVAQSGTGWSVGVDLVGPRLGAQRNVTIRLGGGNRPLPYVLDATVIRETDLSGGLGIPLLGNRSNIDVSLMHQSLTPAAGVSQSGFILSVGVTLRP